MVDKEAPDFGSGPGAKAFEAKQAPKQEPAPDSKRPESLTLCAAVCDARFWLLGGAKFAGMGCGLMLRERSTTHGLSLSPWVVV